MSDRPSISVAMATYNGARFLQAQLLSWLPMLSDQDEVVISDDASTDETVSVALSLKDPRIHVRTHRERLGYQANFERAIRATRGEVIFLSDQDDICLPARVDLSVAALKFSDSVCGDAIIVDANLQQLSESFFEWRGVRNFSALRLITRPAVIGATMAFKRRFLLGALPFPRGVPHDQWLSIVAARTGKLAVLQQPLILYRRHEGMASNSGTRRRRPLHTIFLERSRLISHLVRRGWIASPTEKSMS